MAKSTGADRLKVAKDRVAKLEADQAKNKRKGELRAELAKLSARKAK